MTFQMISALLVTFTLTIPASAAITGQDELNRIADAFYSSTVIDEAAAFDVAGVTITKDIGTFTLKKGTLYLTKPVEGLVLTAVFLGEGAASIRPVRPMDRIALDLAGKDHLGGKPGGQIVTSFDQLVLVTFDESLDQILRSLASKSASPVYSSAAAVLKDRLQMMRDLELPFDLELVAAKSGAPDGPTFVSFKSAEHDWLQFAFEPREQLEVTLYKNEVVGSTVRTHPLIHGNKVGDLDSQGNYVADAMKDQKEWIDVTDYKMEITIPDTSHYLVEGVVTFTPIRDNLAVVPFKLVNNVFALRSDDQNTKRLFLKSMKDASGAALPFVHRKHQTWVVPPTPLKAGVSTSFRFSVDAQTILQISSVHWFILSDAPWYPQHGYVGGQYTIDWTIKARQPLYATGSGKAVKETTEGAYNVTQLVFDQPVWLPFLIFGQYQKVEDVYKPAAGSREVRLGVFSWPHADFNAETEEGKLVTVSVTVPGSKPKSVLEETKEVMKFYESLYGPFPYGNLHVAQMSPGMGFGQGPAGFIQLTGEAFMSTAEIANWSTANADVFHEFFSHEIAHQYWGHTIKWASDEDVWLSESWAEYTAGLYVMGLLGQDRFQGKMKIWKDNARIADPHGTVAWANNVTGENAGLYRTGLLYHKGPYIVHMLRMQVGHENFVKAVKNLITKYRFQGITTDQLRQEFEAVAGYKLDYFFNQWCRDTGIPVFDYFTDVKQSEDGKWLATIKISQRDKERVKIVSMPVFFHFGKDKVIVKDRAVLKAEDVYQVKLPEKPDSITLDDYHTLLADIYYHGAAGQ